MRTDTQGLLYRRDQSATVSQAWGKSLLLGCATEMAKASLPNFWAQYPRRV